MKTVYSVCVLFHITVFVFSHSMALKCIESERNWLITGSGTRWVKICDV